MGAQQGDLKGPFLFVNGIHLDGVDANLTDHTELAYRFVQGMNHRLLEEASQAKYVQSCSVQY